MNSMHGFLSRLAGFLPVTALGLAVTLHAVAAGSGSPSGSQLSTNDAQLVAERFGQTSPVFIENQGQWADDSIRFTLSAAA